MRCLAPPRTISRGSRRRVGWNDRVGATPCRNTSRLAAQGGTVGRPDFGSRAFDRVRQSRHARAGAVACLVPHSCRIHRGARRRVGVRQVGDRAGDPGDPAVDGARDERRDPVLRARHDQGAGRHHQARARRPQDPAHPRPSHLDDLPGADGVAVAAAHDRRPGERGAVPASPDRPQGWHATHGGDAGTRRLPRSRARAAQLSVRAVGRLAPARHDRDGAGVPAVAAGRRSRRRSSRSSTSCAPSSAWRC